MIIKHSETLQNHANAVHCTKVRHTLCSGVANEWLGHLYGHSEVLQEKILLNI